jgi:hypothetical protein
MNEDETSGAYGKYEAEENAYTVLVGKLKKERKYFKDGPTVK